MKKIIFAASLLFATPVVAQTNTVTCAFQNGENFTAIGAGRTTMIQWGKDGDFQPAESFWQEPYLTIIQYANGNSFKAVWNVKSGEAYGQLIIGETGKKEGGPLWCVFK
jgi:hypothetical protein